MTFSTQCRALTTLSLERTQVPIQQGDMWSPEPVWTTCLSCILYFSSVSVACVLLPARHMCVDYNDSCTQPSVSLSTSVLLSGIQLHGKFRSMSCGSLLHLTIHTGSWCCPVTSPFCSLLSVYFYSPHTISIS